MSEPERDPALTPIPDATPGELDSQRCDEAERFQRDLYLYWRVVESSGGLPLSARGALTRPALRRVRGPLFAADGAQPTTDGQEQEDTRTYFLRRLLERLSLVKRDVDAPRLIAGPTTEMERYLAQSLGERLRVCARVWVAGGWWPDVTDAKAEPPRLLAPAPPRVAVARRRLLDTLAAATPGSEYPFPTAYTAGQAGATRPRRSPSSRPIGRAMEATIAGDEVTWRAALRGPLAWLGFVSTARGDQTPGGARYRVTPAALALRAGAGPLLTERSGKVTIQSDFSIVAYAPLHPRTLLTLDLIADAGPFERTARYTLTRASFARARRAGLDAATVMARLEAATNAPLPGNVAVTLADWGRASERITLYEDVSLLEVTEARTLDALLADRTGAQWVTRRLTPTSALIAREHVGRARGWLLRHGECPAIG